MEVDIKSITDIFNTLGVPVAVMLMFGFALWKVVRWVGVRVEKWVEPLIAAHLAFVQKLDESRKNEDDIMNKMNSLLQQQGAMLQQQGTVLGQNTQMQARQGEVLEALLRESAAKAEVMTSLHSMVKEFTKKAN